MFFEKPQALKRRHAELYAELVEFYKQDPGRGLKEARLQRMTSLRLQPSATSILPSTGGCSQLAKRPRAELEGRSPKPLRAPFCNACETVRTVQLPGNLAVSQKLPARCLKRWPESSEKGTVANSYRSPLLRHHRETLCGRMCEGF